MSFPFDVSMLSRAAALASPAMNNALQAMRTGRPVVLRDSASREDEADLIVAAEQLKVSTMALMIRECSGIVCLCLTSDAVHRLALPPMISHNESRYLTPFTISIEAREGVTTGVSAQDRVTTIKAAIAKQARPHDLVRPGHVFPLRAHDDGVLGRQGHTEGAIELARLAGMRPSAVLCELMNADGSMMKGQDIQNFATQHELSVVSIEELVSIRQQLAQEKVVSSIKTTVIAET